MSTDIQCQIPDDSFCIVNGTALTLSSIMMMRSRQKNKTHDSSNDTSLMDSQHGNTTGEEEGHSKTATSRSIRSWKIYVSIVLGGLVFIYVWGKRSNGGINIKETKSVRKITNHHACDGYNGVYHIQSGDVGGAAATIFFQFVIAQLIWAEDHNYKPWIYLNNISHHVYDQEVHNATKSQTTVQFTMLQGMQVEHKNDVRQHRAAYPGKPYVENPLHPHVFSMTGDGVWEHYFEPVSDFVPGDTSCETKPLVTMDIWLITPGLHIYADWTPRMWRYNVLPDYMQQRHMTLREWLTPQRLRAHAITQKYIRVKSYLWEQAEQLLHQNVDEGTKHDCVGLHIRWSDKGGGRRRIGVDEFLPFVERFLQSGGTCVFVATDSGKVLQHIAQHWPERVRAVLSSQGDNIIRSNDETPVFEMKESNKLVSHHRTNTEVLVDILALSKCQFLLHGHSAVSDAAMYLNDKLIYQSLNLEDPDDLSLNEFGSMVNDVLVKQVEVDYARYFPPSWWQQTEHGKITTSVKQRGCDGYDGILHIKVGGGDDFSFGMTFFHFILNQLLFADMNNLKPWIHLDSSVAKPVFDDTIHNGGNLSVEVLNGAEVHTESFHSTSTTTAEVQVNFYPVSINTKSTALFSRTMLAVGNGVWRSYFAPVSDFDPSDRAAFASCKGKPMISLNKTMVLSGIHKWAPWSIRSFNYSGLSDDLWWPKASAIPQLSTLAEWYRPMRVKAHDLVTKYYNPHSFLWKRVHEVNPPADGSDKPFCIAVHLRQGDKEGYGKRKPSRLREFKPYIEAYLRVMDADAENRGLQAANISHVYVATDSWRIVDAMAEKWPSNLMSRVRSQGPHVVRSVRWVPAHLLEPENHHRVNLEALVDILAMSQCQFLLHGFCTVAEAVIYINLDLHANSVNLDDPGHISVQDFEDLVRNGIGGGSSQRENG